MSESMLTSEAANTSEGQATSQGAAPDATQGTPSGQPAAAPSAAQQQAAEGQTEQGRQADASGAEGESGKVDDTPKAPEKYEFKPPEGKEYDPSTLAKFSEIARKHDMTQEAAQSLLDDLAPMVADRQAQALETLRTEWAEASRADKEFGGANLDENMAVAKKAMDKFATPELRALLNESGLGNHPELIRVFYRAGKAISEDKFVPPSVGGVPSNRAAASVLYPSQQK